MPFIHLVKIVFLPQQEPAADRCGGKKKTKNKKPALSASLFQPMVKNWGGAPHLNTRSKSSEFKERINLVHSLQDFIGFSGL